jgi:pimeloyl-ACP methyl ester carboxylesterase
LIPASSREDRIVAGRRLELLTIPVPGSKAPIVMLHEGLGSVSTWRDFPAALAQRTGRTVVAYSRYGHGRSERLGEAREVGYMHDEATIALPALLEALGVSRPVLFGHSDGASIALIFAARRPHGARALVLEAPHVFVEPLTLASIGALREPRATADLIDKLRRHHDDAAATFRGWNDVWLRPAFRDWNIADDVAAIDVPTLLIQGRDDEYGTLAQLDAINAALPRAEQLVLERSGHSPHRTQTAAVLDRTAAFLADVD